MSNEDRYFITKVCSPLLWQIWFAELLQAYEISNKKTFGESVETLRNIDFKGELPLQSPQDMERVACLHWLCVTNSSVNGKALEFNASEFLDLFELSLSLNTLEKLAVLAALVDGVSNYQWSMLYDIFIEERNKFQKLAVEYSQDIITLLLQQFGGRTKLLVKAYQIYFGDMEQADRKMIGAIEIRNEQDRHLVGIRLAKTKNQKAHALGNYARFLKNQKQDYPQAEEMYQRAIKADPKHANNLGNYANFLFVSNQKSRAIQFLEKAENQPDLVPDLKLELAFYRYAHCLPYDQAPVKKQLQLGARSIGWDLNANIERAGQDQHPCLQLLASIAEVIRGEENIDSLEQYSEWKKTMTELKIRIPQKQPELETAIKQFIQAEFTQNINFQHKPTSEAECKEAGSLDLVWQVLTVIAIIDGVINFSQRAQRLERVKELWKAIQHAGKPVYVTIKNKTVNLY